MWQGHTRIGIEYRLVDSEVKIISVRYKMNIPNFGGVSSMSYYLQRTRKLWCSLRLSVYIQNFLKCEYLAKMSCNIWYTHNIRQDSIKYMLALMLHHMHPFIERARQLWCLMVWSVQNTMISCASICPLKYCQLNFTHNIIQIENKNIIFCRWVDKQCMQSKGAEFVEFTRLIALIWKKQSTLCITQHASQTVRIRSIFAQYGVSQFW